MHKGPKLSPEARLKAIIDATRAGTWEWNLDSGEVVCNDRWANMLGYERSELEPMSFELWKSLCHPDDAEEAKARMGAYLRGETPYFDCVIRLRHRDSHWRWIHTRGQRLEDDQLTANWICGTHLDISEERETQHRLQRLAESLPGVIYTFVMDPDASFRFTYVSPKSMDFYGIPAEETQHDPAAIFDIILPEDRSRVQDSTMESAKTMSEWRCQYRIRVGGNIRWMEGVAQPEEDEVGRIVWHGMVMDITERKQLELELERLSVTDELTGLHNRRYMLRIIEEQIARAERYGDVFSLIALDIDHFKSINDTWGHLVGDRALSQFAQVLQSRVRRTDVVARTGGEEFLVLLPSTDLPAAHCVAEDLRQATENESFDTGQGQSFTVTMSGGVVTWQEGLSSIRDLLSRCDRSLYQAKHQGRNRIVISDQD
ncbi:diguanylate cyclase [Marinobacter lacisalsi]|uniref:diguanylate cyclase n=1 Tax=Marinobacter lacisalsi TaxID=475979 RepID=A0ABV8QD18_9GAMM